MSDGRRLRRVEESVRAKLAQVLIRDVGDRRLAGLVITRVEMSADLGLANVSVRLLAGDEEKRIREGVMRALRSATGRLRRGLGRDLRMKKIPELKFHYDAGHDAERRVTELLDEVAEERRAQEASKTEQEPGAGAVHSATDSPSRPSSELPPSAPGWRSGRG